MSKKKSDIKRGNIDVSDLEDLPEEHEFRIARYFADRGKNVRFIQRSNILIIKKDEELLEYSK